jgi:membrane protease YdiL (CAAX protease family)
MAELLTTAFSARRRLKSRWAWSVGLTATLVAVAATVAVAGDHGGVPLVMTLTVLAMLLFPYLAFATTSFARDIGWWMRRSPKGALLQIFAFVVSGYVVYAVGTGSFSWDALIRVAAFVGAPTLLVLPVQRRTEVTWLDWLAVAAIWIPFDFGLLKTIWTWPAGGAAYMLNTVMAINLAVILFVGWRGISGVNFRFSMERRDVALVVKAFLGFLLLAVPFGLATGFIAFNPQVDPVKAFLTPVGFFFFVGIPEELLFRGLVQNFLQRTLRRPRVALIVASVIFGATHLNNGPVPDWRYFVLATVAGLFYGALYARTKSLAVPALVHAMVDSVWVLFLHV